MKNSQQLAQAQQLVMGIPAHSVRYREIDVEEKDEENPESVNIIKASSSAAAAGLKSPIDEYIVYTDDMKLINQKG